MNSYRFDHSATPNQRLCQAIWYIIRVLSWQVGEIIQFCIQYCVFDSNNTWLLCLGRLSS